MCAPYGTGWVRAAAGLYLILGNVENLGSLLPVFGFDDFHVTLVPWCDQMSLIWVIIVVCQRRPKQGQVQTCGFKRQVPLKVLQKSESRVYVQSKKRIHLWAVGWFRRPMCWGYSPAAVRGSTPGLQSCDASLEPQNLKKNNLKIDLFDTLNHN